MGRFDIRRLCCLGLLAAGVLCGAEAEYHVKGQLQPPMRAAVTLDGFTTTFNGVVLAADSGQFEFKALRAGTYTLVIAIPNRGEMRRTVEIGPSAADAKGLITLTIKLDESLLEKSGREGTVTLKELQIPEQARKAWDEAQRQLGRRNLEKAIEALEEAVRIAPDFSPAWNNLGTMYYKSQRYIQAEKAFRASLKADPDSFEPLVNLGGVLLTLNRPSEAYVFNLYSVLERPEDALANSQMGMNYFSLGRLDLARKYLNIARTIDPGHFSRPQLMLAEICLRKGDLRGAAHELEEYLQYHPDVENRDKIREQIQKLKTDAEHIL
jgi:tetratricopeptide (TPR) repeat protein